MATDAGSAKELEALVTRIYMDASDFVTNSANVLSQIDTIEKRFSEMGGKVAAAAATISAQVKVATAGLDETLKSVGSFGNLETNVGNAQQAIGRLMSTFDKVTASGSPIPKFQTAISGLFESIGELTEHTVPLKNLQGGLKEFVEALGPLSQAMTPATKEFARSMRGLGQFLESTSIANFAKMTHIPGHLEKFADKYVLFAGKLATAEIGSASSNLSKVGSFLSAASRFKGDEKAFEGMGKGIESLFTSLSTSASLSGVGDAGNIVSKVSSFLRALNNADLANIGKVKDAIGDFFGTFGQKYQASNAAETSRTMMRFGTAVQKLSGADPEVLKKTVEQVSESMKLLNLIPPLQNTEKVALTFSRLGTALKNISFTSTTALNALPQMVTALHTAMLQLATIPIGDNVPQLANTMYRLGTAMNSLTKFAVINPTYYAQAAAGLKTMMNTLNSLQVGPDATRAANALHRVSQAAKNFAFAGASPPSSGGGGWGGWFRGLLGGFGGIPPAARNAKDAADGVDASFKTLTATSSLLGTTLWGVRMSLAGIAAFGAKAFGDVESALLRTMARARDFTKSSQGELFSGVMGISGQSTSSTLSLSQGLRSLTDSGQSATMALESLGVAEDFAVATGMKVQEVTKKLTDFQFALGKASEDPLVYGENMRKLSDLLVGISPRVGASEAQLMEGFTSHFLSAARIAKMSVEESLTVIGLMARAGEPYRGSKGGDIAARAITQLSLETTANPLQWIRLLGDEAMGVDGKIKPVIDILTLMESKVASLGTKRFLAELNTLNFSNYRTISAIEPLLHVIAGAGGLRAAMEEVDGVTRQVADTMRSGLLAQMQMLGNNLYNVAVVAGTMFAPVLRVVIEPVTKLLNAFTLLNPAFQNLIVWGTVAVFAFRPLVGILWGLGGALLSLAAAPFVMMTKLPYLIADGFMAAWGYVKYFGSVVGSVFSVIKQPFVALIWLVNRLGDSFVDLVIYAKRGLEVIGTLISQAVTAAGGALNALLIGVFSAFSSLAAGLILWIIVLPPIISLLITLLSAVGGLVVTVGIGIYQLVGMIGGALVAAWSAFKMAAIAAIGWVGGALYEINGGLVSLWGTLRESVGGFAKDVGNALSTVAGLLWNFRENAKITLDWISKYGAKPFEDIANAAFIMIEEIVHNLGRVSYAIGQSIVAAFRGAWVSVQNYSSTFFYWFSGQWDNMASDIGMVFKALIDALAANMEIIASMLTRLKRNMEAEFNDSLSWTSGLRTKAEKDDMAAKFAADRQRIIADSISKMTGPFDSLADKKFKTDFNDLGTMLGTTNGVNSKVWSGVGREIANAFGEAYKGMNPIMAGFDLLKYSPMWAELMGLLNLTPPTIKEAGKYMSGAINPLLQKEGSTGEGFGKEGPGFTLKQGSMARFEYEGSVNERMDYQQLVVMKMIERNTAILAQQRGVDPVKPDRVNSTNVIRTMPRLED